MIEETGITSQFSRFISVVRLIGLFETIFREKSFSNVEWIPSFINKASFQRPELFIITVHNLEYVFKMELD